MNQDAEERNVITVEVKLDEIKAVVGIGVRRASAFVRLGLDGLDERGKGDFNLAAGAQYRFWPQELSGQDRDMAREEFRSWLVGSCLRELDLFYGLFLDRVWQVIEIAELEGAAVSSNHVFGRSFLGKTNVGEKQKEVAEKLGVESHHQALKSLSLARNALAHHAGIVRTPRDCNNEERKALDIQWIGLETVVSRGGVERVFNGDIIDTSELPGEGPSTISVKVVLRSHMVSAGDKITLTTSQLAELCMFYIILRDKVLQGLMAFLRAKGHELPAPPERPVTSLHHEHSTPEAGD